MAFGSITGRVDAPLDLGFVKVKDFGVSVNGNAGNAKIPYGFFKYKDSDASVNSKGSGTKRKLNVFANGVTLEMGRMAQAIAPIARESINSHVMPNSL